MELRTRFCDRLHKKSLINFRMSVSVLIYTHFEIGYMRTYWGNSEVSSYIVEPLRPHLNLWSLVHYV